VVAQSVPNSNITPSRLSSDNSTKNFADGSFDQLLKTAQSNLLGFKKLEFKFHVVSTKQKEDVKTEKEPNQTAQIETSKSKENTSEIQEKFELDNTETLKEVLTKNIPPANITFNGLFAGNIPAENIMLSKTNLQLIINDIIKQAKLIKSQQKTELSLSLANKELGKMFVNLVMKNGQVSINISAGTNTKRFLEDHLEELEMALEKSEINLDSIKISEVHYGQSNHLPN